MVLEIIFNFAMGIMEFYYSTVRLKNAESFLCDMYILCCAYFSEFLCMQNVIQQVNYNFFSYVHNSLIIRSVHYFILCANNIFRSKTACLSESDINLHGKFYWGTHIWNFNLYPLTFSQVHGDCKCSYH